MGLVYKKMVTPQSYTMFAAVTKAPDFWQTLTGGSHTPSLLSGRLAMKKYLTCQPVMRHLCHGGSLTSACRVTDVFYTNK